MIAAKHLISCIGLAFVASCAVAGSMVGEADRSASQRTDDAAENTCVAHDECANKVSIRGCYACCGVDSKAAGCEDACHARLIPDVPFDITEADAVNGYLMDRSEGIDQNNALTDLEFQTIEYISAASESEALRRFGLAIMADAWQRGLISDHAEDVFVESFDAALTGDDFGVRATAMALVLAEGIPVVNDAPVIERLTEIVNSGGGLEDEIAAARPSLDEAEVADRARDHRDRAAEVLVKISGP